MRPTAKQLLTGHPLTRAFHNWLRAKSAEPSKRQASKYLRHLDDSGMKWGTNDTSHRVAA